MTFAAFQLPGFRSAHDETVLERSGVRAVAPSLTPDHLHTICAALHDAHRRLVKLPVSRIIAAIDAAARRLRDPASPDYHDLITGTAAFTGYSWPMAAYAVDRMSADWLAAPLEQLVRTEFGSAAVLDGFGASRDGRRSRAAGVPLTFHVFAGNVPGVSVTSIVRALLVKSAVLGKTAADEPLLAPCFARLLADADPAVGAAVAITYWSGGNTALEQAALAYAGTVIHYGSAAAVASLRERVPPDVRFLEHGPRFSCAIINGEKADAEAADRAAHQLARAVAIFDQQGCVSPQAAYIVGGDTAGARNFAARLAAALQNLEQEWPRGRIDPANAVAIRELRTRAEFRAIGGEPVELWAGESLAWTVVLEPDLDFAGSCLNRTLVVKHVRTTADVLRCLRPYGTVLQTAGVAGFDDETLLAFAADLAGIGATRITSLADMPWPPPAWHHDGRGPLTELIRWTDLEIPDERGTTL